MHQMHQTMATPKKMEKEKLTKRVVNYFAIFGESTFYHQKTWTKLL